MVPSLSVREGTMERVTERVRVIPPNRVTHRKKHHGSWMSSSAGENGLDCKICCKVCSVTTIQRPVSERPISVNPGSKFYFVFVFYIPLYCLG